MGVPSDRILAEHPWHALFFAVCALYVYGAFMFTLAGLVSPDLVTLVRANDPGAISQIWVVQCALFLVIFVHMSFWAEKVGAGPFAVPVDTSWRSAMGALIVGPMVYFVIMSFCFRVLSGGAEDWAYTDDDVATVMSQTAVTGAMIGAVVIIGPIFEEVAYRGIGMGFLLGRGLHPALAIGLSAFIFAISHTQYKLPVIFGVFLFGVFLGILRLKTRSIGPPILAHMSVNFMTVIQAV